MTNTGPDRVEVMAANLARRARDGNDGTNAKPTQQIVRVEKTVKELPPEFGEALKQLSERITKLENKPEPLIPVASNDAVAVPAAFGEQVNRLSEISGIVSDLQDAMAGLATKDNLQALLDRVAALAGQIDDLEEGFSAVTVAEGDAMASINVTEAGSTELALEVADLTATVMQMFNRLIKENEAIRRRQNKLDEDGLDLIEELRGFARKEKMRA